MKAKLPWVSLIYSDKPLTKLIEISNLGLVAGQLELGLETPKDLLRAQLLSKELVDQIFSNSTKIEDQIDDLFLVGSLKDICQSFAKDKKTLCLREVARKKVRENVLKNELEQTLQVYDIYRNKNR